MGVFLELSTCQVIIKYSSLPCQDAADVTDAGPPGLHPLPPPARVKTPEADHGHPVLWRVLQPEHPHRRRTSHTGHELPDGSRRICPAAASSGEGRHGGRCVRTIRSVQSNIWMNKVRIIKKMI